jgi:hypothetical protein
VKDLVRNLDRRRVTGMSFGFEVIRDEWTTEIVETNDGNSAEVEVRRINEVRLWEVSAVTFPAYDETDAALRAVLTRSDPDPLGRRSTLLDRPAPAEATRDDDSQPAATTGATTDVLRRRHQLKARELRLT